MGVGVKNTTLLRYYAEFDQRVIPTSIFIKQLAKLNDINSSQHGTLHSYNWNLLLIFYLQQINVVPVLDPKIIQPDASLSQLANYYDEIRNYKYSINKDLSVGDLLLGFYDFYVDFDWDKVVSIRRGKSLDIDSDELILPMNKTFYMKSEIE